MYKDYPKFAWFVVFAALVLSFGAAYAADRWSGPEDQIGVIISLLLFEMAMIRLVVMPNDTSFLGTLRFVLFSISCVLANHWRPNGSAADLLYDTRYVCGLVALSGFAGWVFEAKENRVLGFSFDRNFVGVVVTIAFLIGFNHFFINADDQDFAVLMDVVFCAALANIVFFIPMEGEEKTLVRVALGSISFAIYIGFFIHPSDASIWGVAVGLLVSSITVFGIRATFWRR